MGQIISYLTQQVHSTPLMSCDMTEQYSRNVTRRFVGCLAVSINVVSDFVPETWSTTTTTHYNIAVLLVVGMVHSFHKSKNPAIFKPQQLRFTSSETHFLVQEMNSQACIITCSLSMFWHEICRLFHTHTQALKEFKALFHNILFAMHPHVC